MEEYGIMEYLELVVTRCGWWMGNREFIWSGLKPRSKRKIFPPFEIFRLYGSKYMEQEVRYNYGVRGSGGTAPRS